MTDDASKEAAGEDAGGPAPPMPTFTIRKVPPPTAEERQARRDAMDRAIRFGATPYRDAEGKARYVFFKEANNAPVEAWRRDPAAKRGFRKTQQARKAAGQLIWHPEDQIELARRLGVIHYREGRSPEGAAESGLYDAIWRYEHVWDTFTAPRRIGREIIDTGRIAAVAEEEARKLQAEDPRAKGGFFVRDRKNNGLIYVVPNPDPEALFDDKKKAAASQEDVMLVGGEGEDVAIGQADDEATPAQAETADWQSPSNTNSSPEGTAPRELNYPNIPLPPLESTWEDPQDSARNSSAPPVINMEKDRIKNILANKPAIFEIKDSPVATADRPWYASHLDGYLAVLVYEPAIDYVCKLYDVDPDFVKALMYVENAHGGAYGRLAESVGRARTILPMNINPKTWGVLVGSKAEFSDPLTNVMAGVIMIRRIWERIPEPTVAKVASNYKFTGMENVSDYGARVSLVYKKRLWENRPSGFTDRELENAPARRAYFEGHRRRREALKQQLSTPD